jgi:hypothetical protein
MQTVSETPIASLPASAPKTRDFDAAKEAVARSKDLIASINDGLKQHHRWVASYLAQETRARDMHASRLKRQQVQHERRLKRQRMIRSGRRGALVFFRFMNYVSLRLAKGTLSALIYLWGRLLVGASWAAPKAEALARAGVRSALISSSSIALNTQALALALLGRLSVSFAYIGVRVHALVLASLRAASITYFWVRAMARELALVVRWKARQSQTRVSTLAAEHSERARKGIDDLKNSALTTRRVLLALISRESGQRFRRLRGIKWSIERRVDSNGQCASGLREEPAPKHSTALVPFEPWRCRLPVVQ